MILVRGLTFGRVRSGAGERMTYKSRRVTLSFRDIKVARGSAVSVAFVIQRHGPEQSFSATSRSLRHRHHRGWRNRARVRGRGRDAGVAGGARGRAGLRQGTSSRSTKLVHGGVRYLAQGNSRWCVRRCASGDGSAATLLIW